MFKRWLNHATVHLSLAPRGPILIKSGLETADPTRPGLEFVRTRHALHGDSVYLPGTSLKGALRSHAERVLRGLGHQVCDPFDGRSRCRSAPRKKPPPSSAGVYQAQCPACRTFGSLSVAGRCNVEDAYPWLRDGAAQETEETFAATNDTETRWQVGIDRQTGQSQGSALFDLEVVVAGSFHTTIHLEGFQLWQLGLLGALLQDMDAGDLPVGFGKSRGLGQLAVRVRRVQVETVGRQNAPELLGAGELVPEPDVQTYGLTHPDRMALPPDVERTLTWRGRRVTATGDAAQGLLEVAMNGPLQEWLNARGKRRAG